MDWKKTALKSLLWIVYANNANATMPHSENAEQPGLTSSRLLTHATGAEERPVVKLLTGNEFKVSANICMYTKHLLIRLVVFAFDSTPATN